MNSIQDIIVSLRERTWLSPISAEEMNRRDWWLADTLESCCGHWTATVKKYAYHFPNDDITQNLLADLAALPPAPPQGQEPVLHHKNGLRACPFCGGEAYAVRTVNGTQMFKVGCASCGIEFKAAWYRDLDQPTKDIKTLWNTRVAASPHAQEQGWQPIETAPLNNDVTLIALWREGYGTWWGTSMSRGHATHWMPLPAAPAQEQEP